MSVKINNHQISISNLFELFMPTAILSSYTTAIRSSLSNNLYLKQSSVFKSRASQRIFPTSPSPPPPLFQTPFYQTPKSTCNSSFCSAVREEKLDIVAVPMDDNLNSSLEKFLSSELIKLENEWFCPSCNSCKESIKDTLFIQSPPALVIHLKRFCIDHDKIIKNDQFFKCFPEDPLQIRITDNNEVSFFNSYSLVAKINHSGSLNNGHYWAIITDDATNQWFSYTDKIVFEIKADDLINKTYVLFYVRKWFSFYFIFICYFNARGLCQFRHYPWV